jgi:hypothetical protein
LEAEVKRLYPDEPAEQTTTSGTTKVKPAKVKGEPKEPKAPREPSAPGERPKSTTTTGKVWDIADKVLGKTKLPVSVDGWKSLRTAIMAACDKEGINKATAATQYSKWKAAKSA